MRLIFILFLVNLGSSTLFCQINDNFSDGNYTDNPTWVDVNNHFKVNEDFLLQLDAPDAGSSFIYTENSLEDSIRWSSYCLMDFAPSASNILRIILAADDFDAFANNSLYFEIGESGSDDALNLYETRDGITNLLASGTMAALGGDPAEFKFILEKSAENLWTLIVDYGQSGNQLEWEMSMDIPWLDQSVMFGYYMEYTSTRIDKFFFDDILVEELLPDSEPPTITSATSLNSSQIEVRFSEPMDVSTLTDLSNYNISPDLGNPVSVDFDVNNTGLCILNFDPALSSDINYTLTINGVNDVAGNTVTESQFELRLLAAADVGDLVVNEILFNPTTGGFDYVEIYNNSEKFIDLSTLTIANIQRDSYKPLEVTGEILPGEYYVIMEEPDWLIDNYIVQDPDRILVSDIPLFNDSDGNVAIISLQENGLEVIVDSVDYSEEWHYILLDDEEGVSLERLSFSGESNNPSNWHSASGNVGFGTPGYQNSQFLADAGVANVMELDQTVFSPNQDGDGDQLVMKYNLDKNGYLATIKVFNDRGFLVKEIEDNTLIGTEGFLTWDGTKNDTQNASVGIYLIVYELFHPDGDIFTGKLSCVLADFLGR